MVVRVYWNIHKNCWSIQRKSKVIGHANSILLKDVVFLVSEAGRQRVLREKRKNVHAFARGEIVATNETKPEFLENPITYNPYKFSYFYNKNKEEKVERNSLVYCGDRILFGK